MKKFFLVITLLIAGLYIYAREVYCVIQKENDVVKIIPNREYLNDFYWDYITKDSAGNEITFTRFEDAINQLANFGWNIVKTEQPDTNTVIMSHEVDSYMDIKSSREMMQKLIDK